MNTRHPNHERRIGDDSREASPSTGAEETAECMDVVYGIGEREVITVTDGENVVEQAVIDAASKKDFVGVST